MAKKDGELNSKKLLDVLKYSFEESERNAQITPKELIQKMIYKLTK
ncbi:hypothetical protein N781_17050 [Pontibacillus halophilus JSM 076056 = DSM 19796]|uniref:Uncharacterized protein n=1 Tax=Pontibacillus halophilus JSM 076056 = DSM 19796 TaxID=1385510 RepID=A0A0A5GN09_9BACI|nr:hypothetical protein [Pontibacillus halophilus]KGX92520.1 hypothetical protein N781_17050 [Pontibacillus halophilus JSM 076056 = DSM 19796]